MKGRALFLVLVGIGVALLRWKRAELTALISGQRPELAPASGGTSGSPASPAPSAPPAEATRPSDEPDAARTTLAAQQFPTGAAATEEVAVDAEDEIPDGLRTDSATAGFGLVAADVPSGAAPFETDEDAIEDNALERLAQKDSDPGKWVRGDGTTVCPDDYPIKGNGSSHIYHVPGESSYAATIAELCFATEDAAAAEGFRPTKRNRHDA